MVNLLCPQLYTRIVQFKGIPKSVTSLHVFIVYAVHIKNTGIIVIGVSLSKPHSSKFFQLLSQTSNRLSSLSLPTMLVLGSNLERKCYFLHAAHGCIKLQSKQTYRICMTDNSIYLKHELMDMYYTCSTFIVRCHFLCIQFHFEMRACIQYVMQ